MPCRRFCVARHELVGVGSRERLPGGCCGATIVGRISYVGDFTFDRASHTCSLIEVESSTGLVELKDVLAPNDFDRAIEPGRDVAMAAASTPAE